MQIESTHFISLNVGLRNTEKRQIIYNWIKKQKANICLLQETHVDKAIEKIIKSEWNGDVFNSCGPSNGKGVMILLNKNVDIRIENVHIADDNRKILVNLYINKSPITVINVYAPTIYKAREEFFKKTFHWIHRNAKYNVIIGGDFNCVQDKLKDTKNIKGNCKKHKHLQKIMTKFNLIDIWRKNWPDKRQFTWRQVSLGIASRLDYWLVNRELKTLIQSTDIRPSIKSDHNAISLKLKTGSNENGPGYWKFNASLCNDSKYKDCIRNVIKRSLEYSKKQGYSKQITWENCKADIKQNTIQFCKNKSKNKKSELVQLQKKVSELENHIESNHNKEEYLDAKSKLNKMYTEITKGSIVRSRTKWYEEGETNSKYFMGLEKHKAEKTSISELKTEKGKTLTNIDDILNETVDFYSKLYKSKNIDKEDISDYVDNSNTKVLTEVDAIKCEGLLSVTECTEAMLKLKLNKSPGSDGLTPEFYKTFWVEIKEIVTESLNECFIKGECSFSQKRGLIKLLHKKGDRNKLNNYRPISLLNYDYKICTLALAIRLQSVIGNIIGEEQTGYIKGRYIGQNVRLIEDVIDYCTNNNKEGAILFVDFEKAFDSLEMNFLFACLQKMGFGTQFVTWVKSLYNNISSCILINGWKSKSFSLSRGIRQGCPLSALLFILASDFMSTNIRNDKTINGIQFRDDPNMEIKITQLADDTTIFVNDNKSIGNVITAIERFGKTSGLMMNLKKSEGMWLGNTMPSDIDNNIRWTDKPVKSLGIYFGKDKHVVEELNWKPKISNIDRLLNSWKRRNLTYYGKVCIVKTLGLSQIIYNASMISVPKYVINIVNKRIFQFLWGSKCEKVKRETITGYMEYGGLDFPHVEYQIMALRIKWISRLCNDSAGENDNILWKRVIHQWFADYGGLHSLLNLNCKQEDVKEIIKGKMPSFYQDILEAWFVLLNKCNKISPCNAVLWGNDNIRHKGKVLFFTKWIKADIMYLKDIICTNRFLDLKELDKMVKCPYNLFNLHKLIAAVPKTWKDKIKAGDLSWWEKCNN